MKYLKIFLILMLGTLPLLADLSIQNIEKMVKDIRAKRTSKIKDSTPVSSPFIIVKQDENISVITKVPEKVAKANFVLGAIVNQRAFIDGSWRSSGDSVGDFKLDSIGEDNVVLKRKNRTITLYFHKAKNLLKIGKE